MRKFFWISTRCKLHRIAVSKAVNIFQKILNINWNVNKIKSKDELECNEVKSSNEASLLEIIVYETYIESKNGYTMRKTLKLLIIADKLFILLVHVSFYESHIIIIIIYSNYLKN